MSCPNCEQAALRAWWPRFTAKCYECAAREMAQGPAFFASLRAGHFTHEYAEQLRATYGRNVADLECGHRAVRNAARTEQQPRLIA